MEKLGLVLCGGGARGAFQVGVWEELDKLGITKQITGFSGTSIGAVNTALFLSNYDIDYMKEKWCGFSDDNFKKKNKFPELIINGIFSQSVLEVLLDELKLDYTEYDVFSTVTEISGSSLSIVLDNPAVAMSQLSSLNIKTAFIDWNTVTEKDESKENRIKRYVRYSAKLPFYNGMHVSTKRIGHFITDGGLRDAEYKGIYPFKMNYCNTPIAPLYAIGYRKFIVVYLTANEKKLRKGIELENKRFPGSEFCRIIPQESLGDIDKFDGFTLDRMKSGKEAVEKMLADHNGNLFYEETYSGMNIKTISKTLKCIQRGEKIVNGKVKYYFE